MPANYKALILVMFISIVVLMIGKPFFTQFMRAEDFLRRRNAWLTLTAAAFLTPNIWLYVLVAAPVIFWGAQKDPNPAALYLFLLLTVPPLQVQIPTLGFVGQIFPLNHLRLLSLALMLPVAVRLRNAHTPLLGHDDRLRLGNPLMTADVFLVAYLALQLVLMLPYVSMTTSLRHSVLLLIDVALPYFVVSRSLHSTEMITEAMGAFVMALFVLVPLAIFEFFRGWMLYAGIQDAWHAGRMFFPLYRGPFMRAITTAGHSINLGYFMAMGIGMWLYLQGLLQGKGWRALGFMALAAGLIATLARGPWLGALTVLVFYLSAGPQSRRRSLQALVVVGGLVMLASLSPWWNQIVEYLPFVGSIDEQTIVMRQHLAEGAWQVIRQNPIFGSPYFLSYMEDFRTGEGIIDLVNTYATIALSFGLVGAGLFVAFFLSLILQIYREARFYANDDPESSLLGASLIGCIAGTLVIIATTSFQLALPSTAWALGGLAAGYLRLSAARLASPGLTAAT